MFSENRTLKSSVGCENEYDTLFLFGVTKHRMWFFILWLLKRSYNISSELRVNRCSTDRLSSRCLVLVKTKNALHTILFEWDKFDAYSAPQPSILLWWAMLVYCVMLGSIVCCCPPNYLVAVERRVYSCDQSSELTAAPSLARIARSLDRQCRCCHTFRTALRVPPAPCHTHSLLAFFQPYPVPA